MSCVYTRDVICDTCSAFLFVQVVDNREDMVESSTVETPYVVKCDFQGATQFFVVSEKRVFVEVSSFTEALVALLALYCVFDIAYPKPCNNTLLFLERLFFGLATGPSLTKALVGTVSDIEKCS